MRSDSVLAAPSLPRHVHIHDDANRKLRGDHWFARWRRRSHRQLAQLRWPSRLLLAVVALTLAAVLKLVVVDPVVFVANELLFTRYVHGKRCEPLGRGHVEAAYFDASACWSRAEIQRILLRLVATLDDVFTRNAIPYWLDSGTLLGAHREQTIIPHDLDADVGIDAAAYATLRANALPLELPADVELELFDAAYLPHGTRNGGIPGRFIHTPSGLYVDIFVFADAPSQSHAQQLQSPHDVLYGPVPSSCFGDCYRCVKVGSRRWAFAIPKSWVYPLQTCMFGDRNVSCPAQPDKYLEYLYGPGYMTPDK